MSTIPTQVAHDRKNSYNGSSQAEPSPSPDQALSNKPMCVRETHIYRGPSLYGYKPVVRLKLALGDLEYFPTDELEGFSERLLELIPTLHEHGCCYGYDGGFVQRLKTGTWLGHVAEHVAIELQCLAASPVSYGKTRGTGETGVYNVVYSYLEERVGLLAGWLALRLIDHLLPPSLQGIENLALLLDDHIEPLVSPETPFNYQTELEALIMRAQRLALGPTTQSLVNEALRRNIPAIRLDEDCLVQFGYGKYQQRICAGVTSRTSHIALQTAGDKALTNRLLDEAGIPCPRMATVHSVEEAVAAAIKIGYPVVTKPLDANHGRGVSLNLTDQEQVRWGFEQAARQGLPVIVEQYLQGNDYRILVVDNKVVAAARRVPAHVTGDGLHTIAQLIDIVNSDPRRGIGHEKVLTRITVDCQVERLLAAAGLTLASVLPKGQVFYLRSTANVSTGGTAIDCTDDIHPDNIELAIRATQVIGLDIAGLDVVTSDITHSLYETSGGVVEINAAPGFRMHLQPSQGQPRNVAGAVIDMLFPAGTPARIPVIAITGTNGKTTTARMVAHVLQQEGRRVGLTTSNGIYINGKLLRPGDTTGPKSARTVLRDPSVDVAVLETARGGILREGLGFDSCDVGAVLNVEEDHLGLKGIEALEDLARVKSLVVEVVQDQGFSVLNADDPLTTEMKTKAGGQVVFFSMHGSEDAPEHLQNHIKDGGTAVVLQSGLKGELIAVYAGDDYFPLMWAHEIPATLQGLAKPNIANALAATAICLALQVPVDTIRRALSSFMTNFEQNPGRYNVYEELPFKVIMDYAHNPAGMRHMVEMVDKLRPHHQRIIGVLSGTGDRRDQDIVSLGRIAATMVDELIVKEDMVRDRPFGETAGLIYQGALAGGLSKDAIHSYYPEPEAVELALSRAQKDDLVIIFATDVHQVWNIITSFRPVPASDGIAQGSECRESIETRPVATQSVGVLT